LDPLIVVIVVIVAIAAIGRRDFDAQWVCAANQTKSRI
jgi:hypothetical protein